MTTGLVLTHGAGSNRNAPLLVALDGALATAGWIVERVDLAFREARPHGSPNPAGSARDRAGLQAVCAAMRQRADRVFLGGHSYGGRQSTMLAAEEPTVTDGLLLLSYPLHPPRRPDQLRTSHFPALRTPALFLHGSRDPFGTLEELRAALALIPARVELVDIERAGHDLSANRGRDLSVVAERIAAEFRAFVKGDTSETPSASAL